MIPTHTANLPPSADLNNPNVNLATLELSKVETIAGDIRILSYSTLGIFCLGILFSMYHARTVIFPVVLAIFLNLLLSPAVRYLRRFRIPNAFGGLIILLFALTSFGFLISYSVEPATEWIQRTPQTISRLESKLGFMKKPIQEITKASERMLMVTAMGSKDSEKVVIQKASLLESFLSFSGGSISELIVSLILTYFLLSHGDRFLTKSVELMPTLTDKKRVVEIARSIEESISNYLLSIIFMNCCFGFIMGLAMWFINVPNAALWGVMACLLNFVPYVGSITGLGIITIVAFVTFDDLFLILRVSVLYLIIDWIEGALITPMIIGRRLDLNPPVMLVWVFLWGWLWGPWGAILALPMLTAIKILCDHIERLKSLSKFLMS